MIETIKGNTNYLKFNSLADFSNYLENNEVSDVFKENYFEENPYEEDYASKVVSKKTTRFTKTRTLEQANEILVSGWEEGAKKINNEFGKIKGSGKQGTKIKFYNDVVGFQCNVPAYLQGVPQSMVNKKTIQQKNKIINIYKNVTYGFKTKAEEIIENSVKALLLVDRLEKSGFKCNLFVVLSLTSGFSQNEEELQNIIATIKIKGSGERLNVSKTAYCLAHPSFLRRHLFRLIEVYPKTNKNYTKHYGVVKNPRIKLKEFDKDAIILNPFITTPFEDILKIDNLEQVKYLK